MAVVVVAGRTPVYELTAADLVVRSLNELSFVNAGVIKDRFVDVMALMAEIGRESVQRHQAVRWAHRAKHPSGARQLHDLIPRSRGSRQYKTGIEALDAQARGH